MKKVILILVALLWCNVGIAKKIILDQCFETASRGSTTYNDSLGTFVFVEVEDREWHERGDTISEEEFNQRLKDGELSITLQILRPIRKHKNMKYIIDLDEAKALEIILYSDDWTKTLIESAEYSIASSKEKITSSTDPNSIFWEKKKIESNRERINDLKRRVFKKEFDIDFIDKKNAILSKFYPLLQLDPAKPSGFIKNTKSKNLKMTVEIDMEKLTYHKKKYSWLKTELETETKGKCKKN